MDADQAVALSSVGAAVALAFVGAGPIVLLALEKGGEDRAPTVIGLLMASALTLAGAFGEIWIVFKSASKLELGGLERIVWLPSLLAGLPCFVYEGLKAMLARRIGEIRIVGQASNGDDAFRVVGDLCPDVVVLSVRPGGNRV